MASSTTTPATAALATIRANAQNNTATLSALSANLYTAAGVTSVKDGDFLTAYNSALDSAKVNGAAVNTTAKLQAVVNAYNDIITLSGGFAGVPLPTPTAEQFAAIGVTGVAANSNALHLLDDSIRGVGSTKVDTVAEVQAMATAASHIMAAAGGNAAQAAALTLNDFTNLGIKGVTAANLAQVQNIIHNVASDVELGHKFDVQAQIDAHLGISAEAALTVLRTAATYDTASAITTGADVYATAGVHGVDSSNLAAVNSTLNSTAISTMDILRSSDVQGIVDAYSAILQSADGVAGNTTAALTAAQYAKVGVTGLSGSASDGSALHLLNDTLDGLRATTVDTVPELQAVANAANHVIAAVGTNGDVTLQDLKLLGITGVNASNLSAVLYGLHHTTTATAVDTHVELQNFANAHHQVIVA